MQNNLSNTFHFTHVNGTLISLFQTIYKKKKIIKITLRIHLRSFFIRFIFFSYICHLTEGNYMNDPHPSMYVIRKYKVGLYFSHIFVT